MIQAKLIERYVKKATEDGGNDKIEEIIHETRYFSSKEKFTAWYSSFKEELWEDDRQKVDLVEGIYVSTEEIKIDDTSKPKRTRLFATFRPGVSYKYAS